MVILSPATANKYTICANILFDFKDTDTILNLKNKQIKNKHFILMNPNIGPKNSYYDNNNVNTSNNDSDQNCQQQQQQKECSHNTHNQIINCHENNSTVFSIPSTPSISYSVTTSQPTFSANNNNPNR